MNFDISKNESLREYEHFKHVFPLLNEFNLISLCDMNWYGPNMLENLYRFTPKLVKFELDLFRKL